MMNRIRHIAANTYREAVRDRVLYNLVAFALLMVGTTPLFGKISIGLERIILVNLGLTAISLFGTVIAIFIGTGLVSKEIEKKTLYTVLSRPVRRWEFILGKYFGLAATLGVNTVCMAVGFFLAVFYVSSTFSGGDIQLLTALYFIGLQFLMIIAIALLFSSFSTPLFSAVFSFAIFVIGNFADDLRGFAAMTEGAERWLALAFSYVVPNFGSMNVISQVAHGNPISPSLIAYNSAYALLYCSMALSAAVLIFERRNLK
jgi:ABC-type transport system involved in multi-copper enzyme maturation permease subunit